MQAGKNLTAVFALTLNKDLASNYTNYTNFKNSLFISLGVFGVGEIRVIRGLIIVEKLYF